MRKRRDIEADPHCGEYHVMMEAEMRVAQPQAKERQRLPAAARSWEEAREESNQSLKGGMALPTP